MADVSISYGGNEIATMSASGTKTLLTAWKYCEDDIEISYTKPMSVNLQSKSVSSSLYTDQVVTPDSGYDGLSSVTVTKVEGGGVVEDKGVNFIDYDGSLLYSYSASEFANLSALPANPTHTGLTAQGWNWTLADAKTYVASYRKLWIGQSYITDDGKTRLYVKMEEGRLSPYLGIAVNGSVDIDWGDSSAHDTLTGSSTSTIVYAQHTYVAGEYVIALTITGSAAIAEYTILTKQSSQTNENKVYLSSIKKVEIGSNVNLGVGAFRYCFNLAAVSIPTGISIAKEVFDTCYALKSVTIPSGISEIKALSNCACLASISFPKSLIHCTINANHSLRSVTLPPNMTVLDGSMVNQCYSLSDIVIPSDVTEFGAYSIYTCYSLRSIVIPSGVTKINGNTFRNCYSLSSITIPSNVGTIGNNAFQDCYGLREVRFESNVPPVTDGNAWVNLPTDCIIYVPYSADHSVLAEYKTATNYPDPFVYTYQEVSA